MFEFLERLQQKSTVQKQMIALGVSVGITGFIFLIWVSAFFIRLGGDTVIVTQEDVEQHKKSAELPTPVESLKASVEGVGDSLRRLRDMFEKANALEYERDE